MPFLLVEGSFGKMPFQIPKSDDVLRVRCKDVMWQKERLLNVALDHLPQECRKVAWLDADVLFSNPDWAVETSTLLDKVPVVQPFEVALWLPQGDEYFRGRGLVWPSFAKAFVDLPGEFQKGNFDRHGHCGYAWAARRDVLDRHGFFDKSIAGGGDHLMAHAMGGDFTSVCVAKMVGKNTPYAREFQRWGRPVFRDVRSRIRASPGHLLHMWHGDKVKRRYSERSQELLSIHFNPSQDLKVGPTGAWEWATSRPELHGWARSYFAQRDEDAAQQVDYSLSRTALRAVRHPGRCLRRPERPHRDASDVRTQNQDPLKTLSRDEDWY